ncbi:hypothetical protein GCM10027451_17490 [Geodermatophilus aquaeductus]|uniref:PH domain-containing protein n=1 Tax=Geodermatophilus aquaeductus TaxID=1564161 RepID=A0A521E2E8_9ACTN|nr:hypothetical protein [Geodermatophilus aquaeductus]SMO78072.1 hypothetical protein SAMN06273567_104165 [Geodermatophilus aquaeductus]
MADGGRTTGTGTAPLVPRVPAGRRHAVLAGAGLLLAVLCGLFAAWGRAALDSAAMWPAALGPAVALPAAWSLFSGIRHDLPRRLRLDGTVLVGRTPLGEHGVDLARVTAVSAGSDPELGRIVAVRLVTDDGHLVVPWSGLRGLPEVCALLAERHRRRALVLPRALCEAWDLPAPLEDPPAAGPPRDGVARAITALTVVGSVAAGAAGVLLV